MQYRKYYICTIIYKIYYYISNYNKYYTTVLFLINSEVFPSIFFILCRPPGTVCDTRKNSPETTPETVRNTQNAGK